METERFRGCRAILFDYGGTLDSDGQHWLPRFLALYDAAGLTVPRDDLTRAFYHGVDTCYADPRVASIGLKPLIEYQVRLQFEALGIQDGQKEKFIADGFYGDCSSFLRARRLLLHRMRSLYRLGIISNFYGNLPTVCNEAGLSPLFEFIVDSNLVGLRKPDPRIFLLALGRFGLPGSEVIFVGDSYERDMVPAMEAGMKAIWLKPRDGRGTEANSVHASISRLSDLEELL